MFHLSRYRRAGLGWVVLIPIMLYFMLTGFQVGAQIVLAELNTPVENFLKGMEMTRIEASLEKKKKSYATIEDPLRRYANIAQLCFIQGVLEETKRNPGTALERFEEAQRLAEQSLAFGASSAAYRILADAYTQQMKYRGLWYQIANGPKIKKYAESALDLDPNNAKAQLALALYLFHAPPIAGGGIEKSVKILHRIEANNRLHPLDRYSTLICLATGYQHQAEFKRADNYLKAVFRLYPRNLWIDDLLRKHNL
jgi:tetratricopeptide (TPR) repeat protein